jgi:hypothetical protein
VIAAGIRVLRPHVEVATAGLDTLEEEVACLDPHVVICTVPVTGSAGDRIAWVELCLTPSEPLVVWMDGRRSERTNPGLQVLLKVVDEAEALVRARNQSELPPYRP